MSCALSYGLDISLAFQRFFIRGLIPSGPLFSTDSTALFLFWVKFMVWTEKGDTGAIHEALVVDCTCVTKEACKDFLYKF